MKTRVVVTDSCVLINLIHVGRLSLCGALPGHEFVIPDHVHQELTSPGQRRALDEALDRGGIQKVSLTDLSAIGLYASLRPHLGSGEAACLALAASTGWMIASDERRLFRREVLARMGDDRLLTTPRIFVLAIEAGLLSVEDADEDKTMLEGRRFKMSFRSFRELVG